MIEQGLVGGGGRKIERSNEYKSRGVERKAPRGGEKRYTQIEKNGKRLGTGQRSSLKELSNEYSYTYRRHTTTNIHLPTK
jgi:hypothetical protein